MSHADEDEAAFRTRVRHAAHEVRDAEREKLRAATEKKLTTLAERARKAQQTIERHTQTAQQRRFDAVVSVGGTLLGSFLGRKSPSATRVGTALRTVNRASGGGAEVERAKASAAVIEGQVTALAADLEARLVALGAGVVDEDAVETPLVRPKATDVAVRAVCVPWRPFVADAAGGWLDAGAGARG